MINKDKIPEPILEEMINLFGEEKAGQLANRVGYSYHGIVFIIINEKFRKRYGIQLIYFIILVVIVFILSGIYYYTWY